jgi:hypothetical protein
MFVAIRKNGEWVIFVGTTVENLTPKNVELLFLTKNRNLNDLKWETICAKLDSLFINFAQHKSVFSINQLSSKN